MYSGQNLDNNHRHYYYRFQFPTHIIIPTFLTLSLAIFIMIFPSNLEACSRMQCAPIISKCQILDACRCEAKLNYTCFKTCSHCLGDLYTDCCSCVDICPKEDEYDRNLDSHVKVFATPNEDLFDLFASEEDLSGRWHVHTQPITTANSTTTMNCTMAFLASCVDMYKCESSCISMGANGYRWFHCGCCECVGKYCMNFGVNEIRCRNCPENDDQVIDSGGEIL